jgi:hypothetical protein
MRITIKEIVFTALAAGASVLCFIGLFLVYRPI